MGLPVARLRTRSYGQIASDWRHPRTDVRDQRQEFGVAQEPDAHASAGSTLVTEELLARSDLEGAVSLELTRDAERGTVIEVGLVGRVQVASTVRLETHLAELRVQALAALANSKAQALDKGVEPLRRVVPLARDRKSVV